MLKESLEGGKPPCVTSVLLYTMYIMSNNMRGTVVGYGTEFTQSIRIAPGFTPSALLDSSTIKTRTRSGPHQVHGNPTRLRLKQGVFGEQSDFNSAHAFKNEAMSPVGDLVADGRRIHRTVALAAPVSGAKLMDPPYRRRRVLKSHPAPNKPLA